MAGVSQGTAIHETAQVTGAGVIYDQTFGVTARPTVADVAIVVKLVRNVFIAAVIPLMALVYSRRLAPLRRSSGERVSAWRLFPSLILGFVGMAMVRSAGDAGLRHIASALAVFLLGGFVRL